ncbi:MAG TPA: restriction endonuclease subunit S [Mycobacteriales bacterium]
MIWIKDISVRGIAEVVLGRQRAPQHAQGDHMVRYLRAANVKDGELDLNDVMSMNFTPDEQRTFALRRGDVLVTEGSGSLASVGASAVWHGEIDGTVCFQNTLLRMRPRSGVTDGRFLGWWARSAFGSGLFASLATGANIYHLSAERVRSLRIDIPPLEEQRRIADFLDAETAQIDSLLRLRANMSTLLLLKRERVVEQILGLSRAGSSQDFVPLKYLAKEITVGIVVTPAAWYVDADGIPALRGVNIGPGRIVKDDLVQISREGHALHRKSQLREGDLVVVRTGQAGVTAAIPAEFAGTNCIDLVVVRPVDALNSRYAEYVLNSDYAKRHVAEYSVGSIQSHFNVGAMKLMPIPRVPLAEQERRVRLLDEAVERFDGLSARLLRQEELLIERRQALITAAVTGQIDVTTARGVAG